MDKNTVLVVMPIYNAEETLSLAIESILKQTYRNFQLVLVDDASTDKSLEIAKSYTYDKRVILYKNSENRGAYYSRNVGLYLYKGKPWGYFTTHDADDVSYPNRFDDMVKQLQADRINGVQDTFERKNFASKRLISRSLTIAHAMFNRSVFDRLGFFEEVRVGADWEHWARLKSYNDTAGYRTTAIRDLCGESFILKNNLTVQIPLNSAHRKQYIIDSREKHQNMLKENNFYISFKLDNSITERVMYRAEKAIATAPAMSSNKEVTIVLLTWQRISFLKKTLLMLSNQSFKDFNVRITNANLKHKDTIEKIAEQYNNKLNIDVSHEGNDIKAFRRFTVGRDLAQTGTKIVLFIDDDITFPADYVERLVNEYEPKTYKSGFAWNFQEGGKDYYRYRKRRWDNLEKIHYCGTGISMVDASIFLNKKLFDAPPEAYYIEDLWLSYFAQHVLRWDLKYVNVGEVHIGGADQHALYKKILADKKTSSVPDKADFLRLLVKKYGWKL